MKFQGIYVDSTTPFDHAGALYRVKVEHNIAKWNRTSVAGYVVAGVAGEGALLSAEDRVALWTAAAAEASKEKTWIAGITSQGVHESVDLIARAADLGYHAALAETPCCGRTSLGVATLYYRSVADRSRLPVLVADRPRYSGVALSAEDILLLSRHPNIAGVVDASGGVEKTRRVVQEARAGFAVLCGDEQQLWESLRAGAAGSVLAFASAAPYAAIALWDAFRTREEEAGADWQSRIASPAELVKERYGVAGLKAAMDVNAYYGGPPRLPIPVLSSEAKAEIAEAFKDLRG
jgi:4-hydroxy-2-oxoglutarate aldolase